MQMIISIPVTGRDRPFRDNFEESKTETTADRLLFESK
jgi:hypothetical protein